MDKNIELKIKLQKEAEKEHILIGKKSLVAASVGFGKGVLAINRIKAYLETNPEHIKIIFSGARELYLNTFKKELIKFEMEHIIPKITFCCVASLKKFEKENWDLIIIDEVHLDTERIVEFINNFKRKKNEILLLTGTPPNKKSDIGKQLYNICPISYKKSLDDSIEQSVVNNYNITIIYHKLDNEDKYLKYGSKLFQTEQNKYNFLYKCYVNSFNRPRKKFSFEMMNLKQFFNNLKCKKKIALGLLKKIKDKSLIYAGSIEQANEMGVPTYHSKMSKSDREDNLDQFILGKILKLCNVNGIRESANIPNLKYGILMAPDASPNAFVQIVGRFSRLVVGETAEIVVLCTKNTIEEQWLNTAIRQLDGNKIKKVNLEQLEILY